MGKVLSGAAAPETYVELEPGVEVLVRHDVHLREPPAHPAVAPPLHDPDDGRVSAGLLLGLGVLLELRADRLQDLGQVGLGARVRNLKVEMSNPTEYFAIFVLLIM